MAVDLLKKWKDGLDRTRRATFGRVASIFGATEISSETWDDLEAVLIQADLGVHTTLSILQRLKEKVRQNGLTKSAEVQALLRTELVNLLDEPPPIEIDSYQPAVILVVGVNGSGKTTTIAKLGKKYSNMGKKVLLVAADTFRAAAVDQLQVWAEQLKLPIITGQPGADPGAVVYDAVQSAIARNYDLVLIDTAGRLHTRYNLMEELKKVYKVTAKALPGAPHAVWLVLDATTGQNAFQQAKAFKETVRVSGIILAKLDSSAKGGMVLAIQAELGLPILFVGLGEKPDDLQLFDRQAFVDGLLTS